MKKLFTIMIATISLLSCKAQVIPMNNVYQQEGDYYQDTDFFLDNFVGTWQYQNGNEQFTIVLNKELHYDYGGFFNDILYGEYKYVDASGNTLLNTLSDMNNNEDKGYRKITGASFIFKNQYPICSECGTTEFRVKSFFHHKNREYLSMSIVFRYISPTQIKVKLYRSGQSFYLPGQTGPDESMIPLMEYTMNKI